MLFGCDIDLTSSNACLLICVCVITKEEEVLNSPVYFFVYVLRYYFNICEPISMSLFSLEMGYLNSDPIRILRKFSTSKGVKLGDETGWRPTYWIPPTSRQPISMKP